MYGIINYTFELLFTRKFGEHVWKQIKDDAGINMDGSFIARAIYSDQSTYAMLESAVKILGLSAEVILEEFGRMFIVCCEEFGFDTLLRVLGETPKDFVQNLDTLHNHLAIIYPQMRPPSFNCKQCSDGTLVIEYYSERNGLDAIVIGLIEEVSNRILNKKIKVNILETKSSTLNRTLFRVVPQDQEESLGKHLYQEEQEDKQCGSVYIEKFGSSILFKTFPFHVVFDKDLRIKQVGHCLSRIFAKQIEQNRCCYLYDVLEMIRPYIELTMQNILEHLNAIFVFRTKIPVIGIDGKECKKIRLKGQMVNIPECDSVLYLSSPTVYNLHDMKTRGLYLSNIPVHNPIRDLVLLSEQFMVKYELNKSLEVLTDKLQQTNRALDQERKMTDKLVYSVLPPLVADDLRHKRPVPARKYEHVTVMFVGISGFSQFCSQSSSNAFAIVHLLNSLYTTFDAIVDQQTHVYKIETVSDKYMAASGLPNECLSHASSVAKLALTLMEAKNNLQDNLVQQMSLVIGIHSGEVVAGVIGNRTPRYCLFGDTINLASRVETSGLANRINISEDTYRCLTTDADNKNSEFVYENRGPVLVKGRKDPINVWLLTHTHTHTHTSRY